MVGIGFMLLGIAFSMLFFNMAYAQTTETQVTLSGDLQNNPIAQDILKKIEKSKRWIENIQKRNFETLEKQKELEEKRAEVLQYLQEDLKKWEELWGYYTFDKMLERTLENNPVNYTDTIYDHPLKFTASKINAGRTALAEVIKNGGGPEEARDAFVNAAKITRAEMLSVNILYNVLNGNAYYNQQILFDSDGQFSESLSGKQLRKYYQDYRTNPEYLKTNPFDTISWEDLGKNNPTTKCRDGYVLVYRSTADDYVCTTEYTAEMWVRHNMGKVVDENFSERQVMNIETLEQDRIAEKVNNLNARIIMIQERYEQMISETKSEYDVLFVNLEDDQTNEEKKVIEKFNSGDISKKIVTREITDIGEKFLLLEETIVDEKSRILEMLENQHNSDVDNFVKNYERDFELNLVWNSDTSSFALSTYLIGTP